MFKQNLIASALVFSVFIGDTSPAQEKLDLSLDRAIQVGLEKSRGLHASWMRVQYADSRSSEASTLLLPSLKFNGLYSRLSTIPASAVTMPANAFGPGFPPQAVSFPLNQVILDNYNFRVTLQQPLFTGFKLARNSDIAEYTAQATQKDYEKDRSELVYNIKSAYWSLSQSIELQKVIDENVEQMKAHLKDVQSWQAQGMLTANDVLKVQVQLSDAQLRQIDLRNSVELARIALNSLLGIPLETQVGLSTTVRHEPKKFDELGVLVQKGLERRPEFKSMEYRVKSGEVAVSLAQSNWWPQLYLVGDYYTARPNQRIFPVQDQFKDSWDVSLSFSFDLWNWGSTIHQTDQAKAQLAQAQDGLAQLRDAVTLDVTRAYLNLARARERIVVAEQGVHQAEENYRVTNAKFKQGLALNTDVLDAQVALLQARTNYTQALIDFDLGEAALERASGE